MAKVTYVDVEPIKGEIIETIDKIIIHKPKDTTLSLRLHDEFATDNMKAYEALELMRKTGCIEIDCLSDRGRHIKMIITGKSLDYCGHISNE